MTGSRRVLVVGAGLSGLTAAYRLQRAGAEVTVLERATGLAGRAISTHRDGFTLDRGADAVTGGYHHYIKLCHDLGLGEALTEVTNPAATLRDGKLFTYSGSAWSLARSPMLSMRSKLRIAGGMARIRGTLAQADSSALHRLAELDDPAVSARDYSEGLFGTEATDYLIEPVIRLINGFAATEASAVDVVCALALAGGNYALKGGVGVLADTLAARVPVRRGVEVLEVTETGSGVEVRARSDAGDEVLPADACVLATMLAQSAAIHAPTAEATAEMRSRLRLVDLIKVQLGYSAATRTSAFLVQTPMAEEPEVLGMFLDHNKHRDRAPAGHSMVTVYTDSPRATAWMDRPEDELVAWGREKAESVLPELRGQLLFAEVSRWPGMAIANGPGSYRDASAAFDRMCPGPVVAAGEWFSKTSQESAVAGGERAAAAVLGSWRPAVGVT